PRAMPTIAFTPTPLTTSSVVTTSIGCAKAKPSTTTKAIFPGPGTVRAKIGDASTRPVARTVDSTSPPAQPPSTITSMTVSQLGDHGPQLCDPAHQLTEHPRAGQQDDQRRPDQLRHERQGHFLDLGD